LLNDCDVDGEEDGVVGIDENGVVTLWCPTT
jgi:hypothetical protein